MKPITGYKAGDMAKQGREAKALNRYMRGMMAELNAFRPPVLASDILKQNGVLVTITRQPKRPRNTL